MLPEFSWMFIFFWYCQLPPPELDRAVVPPAPDGVYVTVTEISMVFPDVSVTLT